MYMDISTQVHYTHTHTHSWWGGGGEDWERGGEGGAVGVGGALTTAVG